MKRIFKIMLLMLPVLLLSTGCDFLRKLAGRPVSAEVAAMALELEQRELKAEKAREDSVRLAEELRRHEADSILAMDSLKAEKVFGPSKFGGIAKEGSMLRYHAILGAFSNPGNAHRYSEQLTKDGFPAEEIPFGNGFTAVGICGTDDVVDFVSLLGRARRQGICPDGVWILEIR